MAFVLVQVAILAAVAIATAALTKKPKGPEPDRRPTTLSTRGDSFVPLCFGRVRVAPVFGWAGDRRSKNEGGSDGFFGIGGSDGTKVYYEGGWHLVSVGTVASLEGIWVNGKNKFSNRLTRQNHTSGDTITIRGMGRLKWYWGEVNQPEDEALAARVGAASRFPLLCHAYWVSNKLGAAAVWPDIHYEICVVPCTQLTDSSPWISDGGSPAHEGANPAHVIYQILNAPYPQGLGIPAANLDGGAFEAFGETCETEGLAIHVYAANGVTADEVLSRIIDEVGVALVQAGDKLTIVPIRPPVTAPTIDNDSIIGAHPTITRNLWPRIAVRTVYVYESIDNAHRPGAPIQIDDDSGLSDLPMVKTTTIDITSARTAKVANKIARRNYLTQTVGATQIQLNVTRGARMLHPGQPVNTPYGANRVVSVSRSFDGTARLIVAVDPFAVQDPNDDPYDPGPPPEETGEPGPDLLDIAYELPKALSSVVRQYTAFRARKNTSVTAADVFFGPSLTQLSRVQSQDDSGAGGTLLEDFPTDMGGWHFGIAVKPNILADWDELVGAQSDEFWTNGERVMVLRTQYGDQVELCLIRRVEKVSDTEYRVHGILRLPYDEVARDFKVGASVIVARRQSQTRWTHPQLAAGVQSYVKVVPEDVDIGQVTALNITPTDRAAKPLPVDNLEASSATSFSNKGRMADNLNGYVSGEDIKIEWTNRNPAAANAPSRKTWGSSLPAAGNTSEGTFILELYFGTSTVGVPQKTRDVVTDPVALGANSILFTYTAAMRTADGFGANPAVFSAKLSSVVGGVRSDGRSITITRQT